MLVDLATPVSSTAPSLSLTPLVVRLQPFRTSVKDSSSQQDKVVTDNIPDIILHLFQPISEM